MESGFLQLLLTPSPVMHWLLVLLPLTIAVSGIFGAAERHTGNRRLAAWAIVLLLWLHLPLQIGDPILARIATMATILGWLGLVGYWARHVWDHWPSPVWAHGAVITHLLAIAVACGVALVRAGLYASGS